MGTVRADGFESKVNVKSDGAEFLIDDVGVTATAAEINAGLPSDATAGTTVASSGVTVDENKMVDTMGVATEITRAWNATGSTISKGALVSFVGVHTNGQPKIVLADANVANLHAQAAAQADILTAAAGTVILRGLSPATLNTDSFSAIDDPVYLSETAGAYATAAETESDERNQIVGYVVVKSATVGQYVYDFTKQKALGNDSLQTGTAYANLGTTATVLEMNELADMTSRVSSTVAVAIEGGDSIDITVTLKNAANAAVTGMRSVRVWFSSSATTGAIAADDGITTTASTGLVLVEHTDDLILDCVSSTTGVLVINMAGAGDLTAKYLWVDTPGFHKPVVSAVADLVA